VLMDYRLPDGTGVEATRAIKARWPSARVVMLTGVDDDETLLESIQAGADGYLTKDQKWAAGTRNAWTYHSGRVRYCTENDTFNDDERRRALIGYPQSSYPFESAGDRLAGWVMTVTSGCHIACT